MNPFTMFSRGPPKLVAFPKCLTRMGGDAYFGAGACCQSFAALTSSFIRYTSLPQRALILEAILANRAQIPGQDTVVTQRKSPILH